jgi:hypothetical protein
MSEQKLKIYMMNEYDWWADYSREEARKNYIEQVGEPDCIDKMEEVSERAMERLKYKDEDMIFAITFKEQLIRNPKQGLFASTES